MCSRFGATILASRRALILWRSSLERLCRVIRPGIMVEVEVEAMVLGVSISGFCIDAVSSRSRCCELVQASLCCSSLSQWYGYSYETVPVLFK